MNDHLLLIESAKCLQIIERLNDTANTFNDGIGNRIKTVCKNTRMLFDMENESGALLRVHDAKTEVNKLRKHLFNLTKENNLKVHFFDEVDQLLLRLQIELNKIHKQLK